MNILVNATNLKAGGGLQVADSICKLLVNYPQHSFVAVVSSHLNKTYDTIKDYPNVKAFKYDIKNNLPTLLLGRDNFLDGLVKEEHIDIVLTVFGPSRWNPKCLHLSGFAIPYLLFPESPYFSRLSWSRRVKDKIRNLMWGLYFWRSTKYFFTENSVVSERLKKKLKTPHVFTVTNYYNQIFDNEGLWVERKLPAFEGKTFLTISSYYPHKNLEISIGITRWLMEHHPEFKFRFVMTVDEKKFPLLSDLERSHFVFVGTVDIAECPSLYKQCDIAFQPSLLECFTATFPEAMRMDKPNVTVDLPYAKGLCGDAAYYYSAISAEEAAKALYKVATDKSLADSLINNGRIQLKKYDTYNDRVTKLLSICENLVNNR